MSNLPKGIKVSEFFKSVIDRTNRDIEIFFNVEGKEYKAVLAKVNKIDLWHYTEKVKLELMQSAELSGDMDKPVVESSWSTFLSSLGTEKAKAYWTKNKPKNLAEQLVNRMVDIRVIIDMFPKFLRIYDSEGNEIETNSSEDQEALRQLIANDFDIMAKMSKAYGELVTRTSAIEEEIKNSSPGEDVQSSTNSLPSQIDTDSEVPVIQN